MHVIMIWVVSKKKASLDWITSSFHQHLDRVGHKTCLDKQKMLNFGIRWFHFGIREGGEFQLKNSHFILQKKNDEQPKKSFLKSVSHYREKWQHLAYLRPAAMPKLASIFSLLFCWWRLLSTNPSVFDDRPYQDAMMKALKMFDEMKKASSKDPITAYLDMPNFSQH